MIRLNLVSRPIRHIRFHRHERRLTVPIWSATKRAVHIVPPFFRKGGGNTRIKPPRHAGWMVRMLAFCRISYPAPLTISQMCLTTDRTAKFKSAIYHRVWMPPHPIKYRNTGGMARILAGHIIFGLHNSRFDGIVRLFAVSFSAHYYCSPAGDNPSVKIIRSSRSPRSARAIRQVRDSSQSFR